MPRSDIDKLIAVLSESDYRASRKRVEERLDWDDVKLDRVLDRAAIAGRQIGTIRGGHIVYWGTEVGSTGAVPLYRAVTNALVEDRAKQLLGWTRADAFDTARSHASGEWSRPDAVIAAHPRRKATSAARKVLHALEIEQVHGFGIQSIFQAFSEARGADFAWVFAPAAAFNRSRDLERIQWAAANLGVGLVTFDTPANRSSYKRMIAATRLEPTKVEREDFITGVLGITASDPRLW